MNFHVHHIQSPYLQPFIQYILFNFNDKNSSSRCITSFPNKNVCLGILKGATIFEAQDGTKQLKGTSTISSYISALYTQPHHFVFSGNLDEICIDFTLTGYSQFFPFGCKTYIFREDILSEAFGKDSKLFFETLFDITSFEKRSLLIEQFLLKRLGFFKANPLAGILDMIDSADGDISLQTLRSRYCISEKKLYRLFNEQYDIAPKQYVKITRFRKALKLMVETSYNLTSIAFYCGYTDPSHFDKDCRQFSGRSPGELKKSIINIEGAVQLCTL